MFNKFKKAFVLAPHTDDGELGCGGTISKLIDSGVEVFYIAFSTAEESVPEGFPKNQLEFEVKKATKVFNLWEHVCFSGPFRGCLGGFWDLLRGSKLAQISPNWPGISAAIVRHRAPAALSSVSRGVHLYFCYCEKNLAQ